MAAGKMEHRILVCDIGNTAMKLGIANQDGLGACYTLPTREDVTADGLGLQLLTLLSHAGGAGRHWEACVVASVCPTVNGPLRGAVARYLGCPCLFVPEDLPVPLANHYARPEQVGADRLVGAWAARQRCPDVPGLLVVDFGTAVTFDCVAAEAYLGGLIFPGPRIALAALAGHTAKLPEVGLDAPLLELRPAQDTATSLTQGILHGYAVLVEGLVGRLRQRLPQPCQVVGTGGFCRTVCRCTDIFDEVLPELLLEGLVGLYYGSLALGGQWQPHSQRS